MKLWLWYGMQCNAVAFRINVRNSLVFIFKIKNARQGLDFLPQIAQKPTEKSVKSVAKIKVLHL